MLNDIEELLIERNLQFQSNLKQNSDLYSFDQKSPQYAILFVLSIIFDRDYFFTNLNPRNSLPWNHYHRHGHLFFNGHG